MYYDKETEKFCSEKYYSIGYNSQLNKYLLAVVITWIAWYERFYEITEEEYNMFGTDRLDDLADSLYRAGTGSDRFRFSVKNDENTAAQLKLRDKAKL